MMFKRLIGAQQVVLNLIPPLHGSIGRKGSATQEME